ncbi:unnamed protein product [Tenebrio molitor]|nr:unnamed protein product [Tenebrio molitor]
MIVVYFFGNHSEIQKEVYVTGPSRQKPYCLNKHLSPLIKSSSRRSTLHLPDHYGTQFPKHLHEI